MLLAPSGSDCIQLPKSHAVGATIERRKVASMGKLGDACRARAAECALTASTAGWRRDDALKTMYLTLARQWLDIAEIGDLADWERELRDLATKLDCPVRPQSR